MFTTSEISAIVDPVCAVAVEAGRKVLAVYETDFSTDMKSDQTPITRADRESHQYITSRLSQISVGASPPLPVLSEEGKTIPFLERSQWGAFWLVDPLDGTKEFIKRNGEFTINIALIIQDVPKAGFVYVPVTDTLYFGVVGVGSFTCTGEAIEADCQPSATVAPLPTEKGEQPDYLRVMASRSHLSAETEAFLKKLEDRFGSIRTTSAGSSLKLCRVAEGSVDIYPRFGPTMEWDTAAAHAVAAAAGCTVINPHTKAGLTYNKEDLVNPHFVVYRNNLFEDLF